MAPKRKFKSDTKAKANKNSCKLNNVGMVTKLKYKDIAHILKA